MVEIIIVSFVMGGVIGSIVALSFKSSRFWDQQNDAYWQKNAIKISSDETRRRTRR